MNRIEYLKNEVRKLYDKKNPSRTNWADWLYKNHIFLVADEAKRLARRFGANEELCQAAGLLHDIADSEMSRDNKNHPDRSNEIAREILKRAGFSNEEIEKVVEDAIRFHGCLGKEKPKTIEGKVMATADAVVHLTSDFYLYFFWGSASEGRTYEDTKVLAAEKIERDFNKKILFPDLAQELKSYYDTLLSLIKGNSELPDQDITLIEAKLFTDGGSRGNPGPSAIAYVICDLENNVVENYGEYLGHITNNQAEYQALLAGLKRAESLGVKKLIVHMDSELVVKQLNGLYKIKNQELKPLYEKSKNLEKAFADIKIVHVPRALNKLADKQVNKILDDHKD